MTAYERHPPHPVGGTIEVITGPMFSGKTEELLRRMRRAAIAKQAVCLIKPLRDDRHGTTDVVSHDARRQTAIAVGEVVGKWAGAEVDPHPLWTIGNLVPQGFVGHWNCHYIRTPNFPGFFNQKHSGYVELQDRLRQQGER